jgi:hypothetical protein
MSLSFRRFCGGFADVVLNVALGTLAGAVLLENRIAWRKASGVTPSFFRLPRKLLIQQQLRTGPKHRLRSAQLFGVTHHDRIVVICLAVRVIQECGVLSHHWPILSHRS